MPESVLNINGAHINDQFSRRRNTPLRPPQSADLPEPSTAAAKANAEPAPSCSMVVPRVPADHSRRRANAKILTIEGLEQAGNLSAVQQAFLEEGAFQCGYCTSGMIMGATALLRETPNPTEQQIVDAMNGNICRCGTYPRIVDAVKRASGHRVTGGSRMNLPNRSERDLLESVHDAAHQNPAIASFQLDRRHFLKLLGGGLLVCLTHDVEWAQESGRAFGGHELPKDFRILAAHRRRWSGKGLHRQGRGRTETSARLSRSLLPKSCVFHSIPSPWSWAIPISFPGTLARSVAVPRQPWVRSFAQWPPPHEQCSCRSAAQRWNVDAATLTAADAKITNPKTSQSLSYGELTRGEKLVKVISGEEPLTPAADWKIAGTPVLKAEGRNFVTGKHKYPADIVRPEMLFGAVLRPDGFNATLASIDSSAAEKLPGVKVVRDGEFVGLVAPDAHTAQHALAQIQAKWNVPPQTSNQGLFEYLKANPDSGDNEPPQHVSGSVPQAMASAEIKLEEQYTVDYIAHAPLEPRAAVAEWNDGKLTVWTGTQRPFGVRDELMQAFHLSPAQVRVIQPDMGSGYGGKHTGDAAIEAARLAKAAGKPVKVVWTRRGRIYVGLFPPRRPHRNQGRCERATEHSLHGNTTTTIPDPRPSAHRTTSPTR